MNLSLTRKALARVAIAVAAPLLAVLVVTSSAMGQSAQQGQYEDGGQNCIKGLFTHATGTLEKPEATSYQYGTHAITDEGSGCQYALESGEVNLDDYVGEKVKVTGSAVEGYPVDGGPPLLNVKEVKPLEEGRSGGKATLSFEVDTQGQVPEDATFFGFYGDPGSKFIPLQLADPDGDGTYSGSMKLDKGDKYAVQIMKGSGTEISPPALGSVKVPGEPRAVIQGPQTITLDGDRTISATYEFSGGDGGDSPDNPGDGGDDGSNDNNGNDQYDNNDGGDDTTGGKEGGGDSSDGDEGSGDGGSGGLDVLPDTGGALIPAVGIGVLLIGGGILARRILW